MSDEAGRDNRTMTESDRTLLILVKSAVSGDSDDVSINLHDVTDIIAMSNTQAIPVIVVDGLQRYLTKHPDSQPFANESVVDKQRRMQLIGQIVACERLYKKHETAMAELARIYSANGIRMMVLKGYGLSLDWPVPSHRPVGDLDIYNFGHWKEADDVVARECSVKVDDGHEHHTVFSFRGVAVENHYDFINTKAHRDAPRIEARLKQLAEKGCREIDVQGSKIYLPSADFNAIFLMRHMGQHFAGEHMNLRQVLDWGFFVRAHSKEVDWTSTITFLKEIGLYTFFNQINTICVDYLGFSEASFPVINRNDNLETRILADILHPEFAEEKPSEGLLPILMFKLRRWWHNRWKHPLVYKEWLLPMFLTLLWSHLRRIKTIKD